MDPMERLRELEAENARLRQSAAAPGSAPAGGPRVVREQLAKLLTPMLVGSDGTAEQTHAMADALMRDAIRERVSDIHVEPQARNVRLRFRIDGVLHDAAILEAVIAKRLVRHFMTMADMDPVALFKPEESRRRIPLSDGEVDVRLTFAPSITGDKMNIRLLDAERVETNLGALGIVEDQLAHIEEWLQQASGMFLVTGPTASGKTTTLYSILTELKKQERAIVTIEDPVEFQIDGLSQMQVREDRGLTFSNGIRAMLRLDPDYVMVGEIRDAESARAAAEAAASGRVILSTLHSRDAVGAISSLRSWGLNDHEIAATVRVIVAQRLVRQLCPNCRKEGPVEEHDASWLKSIGMDVPETVINPVGCPACEQLGYRGRTGIFEVWQLGEEDYDMILGHADERAVRRRLYADAHISLAHDGMAKVAQGLTSVEELRMKLGIDPRAAQLGAD